MNMPAILSNILADTLHSHGHDFTNLSNSLDMSFLLRIAGGSSLLYD